MDGTTARGSLNAFIEKAKRDKIQGLDEFDLKRSQRKTVRGQLTRNITHLQNAIDDPTPCIHTIKVIEEKVNNAFKDMTGLDEYIRSFISLQNDDDTVEADEVLGDKWYSSTYKVLGAARKAITDLTPPAPLAAPTAAPATKALRVWP